MAVAERKARTVADLRARRALGLQRRRRRGKLPPQLWPSALQRRYTSLLFEVIEDVRQSLKPLLEELPGLLTSAQAERKDAGEARRIRELIEQAEARRALTDPRIESLLDDLARAVSDFHRVQLRKQILAALGADIFVADAGLAAAAEGFVAENVTLIKSIRTTLLDDVAKAATRAVTSATPNRELSKEIAHRFNVSRARGRLIARDQIGKLVGQVNAQRQRNMGVTEFIWRTSQDERVRPEHVARDGNKYAYSDPPNDELPGFPIQCRCFAEPVLDGILKAAESE